MTETIKRSTSDVDSLANRHRPRRLRDVIGQPDVTSILMAQNRSGDSGHHVKLFSGPSGCGKTTIARALAAFELCENPDMELGDACGECESCLAVIDGKRTHTDVHEHDASSNTSRKEDVERLVQRFAMVPMQGDVQVFIIDEAHGMSRQAEDALLKYVEDLSPHNRVYFLTTEPENVPATIRGRAQHFRLRLPASGDIAQFLLDIAAKEGWDLSREVADLIVELTPDAEGVRAAVTNLSKLAPLFEEGPVTPDDTAKVLGHVSMAEAAVVLNHVGAGDAAAALDALATAREHATGRDVYRALERELRIRWRDQVLAGTYHAATQQLLAEVVDALRTDDYLDVRVELATVRAAYAHMPAQAPLPPESDVSPPAEAEDDSIADAPADAATPLVQARPSKGHYNPALQAALAKALSEMVPPSKVVTSLVQYAHVAAAGKQLTVAFPASAMASRFDDPKLRAVLQNAATTLGFDEPVEIKNG